MSKPKEMTASATERRKDAIRQIEKQLKQGTKPVPSHRNKRRQTRYMYNNGGFVLNKSKDGTGDILSAFKLSPFDIGNKQRILDTLKKRVREYELFTSLPQ